MRSLIVLTVLLPILTWATLPPPQGSYNILFIFPHTTKSHWILHMSLATALADRGHKITMISNHPPSNKHPNISEINHNIEEIDLDNFNVFEFESSPESFFSYFIHTYQVLGEKMYKIQEVKELYNKRKEFDLIVIDSYVNEVAYPFAYEMPFITITGLGIEEIHSAVMGNVINPSYVPSTNVDFTYPMTLIQRAINVFESIKFSFYHRKVYSIPTLQAEITKHFPDLPPIEELERNVSLSLFNTHYSQDMTQPLLPSQIDVAGMHCRPARPLPQALAQWIEEAEHGVIYFSLGSIVRGEFLPVKYRNIILEAFAKMKQRIIWKFEKNLEGCPDNVLIQKWLPQQDILAHPNVKVFITHGGLLSSQETIYHGTPIVALPVFYDQPKVAAKMENAGFGIRLDWEKLTVPLLIETLNEVIDNPKYAQATSQASLLFRDQMDTPINRAVWWTEYVIRHQGAPALRCPGADLSWIEFLCLDVLFLAHLVVFTLFWGAKKLLAIACRDNKKEKEE
ncbi:UDP-glycosyltransferase UGT5-like [Oratosquilla oratoria]|uniref:UDP-glycosyltransferase UGT5-like n=1 Tax=Oratosquilla oratoria TaxID=337810 RepID=UPI003F76FEE9